MHNHGVARAYTVIRATQQVSGKRQFWGVRTAYPPSVTVELRMRRLKGLTFTGGRLAHARTLSRSAPACYALVILV